MGVGGGGGGPEGWMLGSSSDTSDDDGYNPQPNPLTPYVENFGPREVNFPPQPFIDPEASQDPR